MIDSPFYRFKTVLAHPRAGWVCVAVAWLLCVPSLWSGLMMDDYGFLAAVQEIPDLQAPRGSLDMFSFARAGDVPDRIERGTLPWWTVDDYRLTLWRPAASITHWLDFTLWPAHPVLMHIQNLLWLGALILLVAHLHRRLLGSTWVAGLATLIYAIDDARATPAGWIANRNALMAAFFGLAALALHMHARRTGSRAAMFLAPLSFLVGLLSNEGGIAAFAFLVAYALFLDRGTYRARALTLAPYALVAIGWRIAYHAGDYGVFGSSRYIDPAQTPLRFLAAAVYRLPALLNGQFALPPSDLFSFDFIPLSGAIGLWLLALTMVTAVVLLLWPFLRQDPTARFLGFALLACLVPSCAVHATDRLLIFAGVGATALLALFLVAVHEKRYEPALATARALQAPFYFGLLIVHLVMAPILLVTNIVVLQKTWKNYERAVEHAPLGDATGKTVVMLNHRRLPAQFQLLRHLQGRTVPERLRYLGPTKLTGAPTRLTRLDDRTLAIRPERGFSRPGPSDPALRFAVGDRIRVPGLTAEIRETERPDLPLEVAYTFDVPLEDESLIWVERRGTAFKRLDLPRPGESIVVREEQEEREPQPALPVPDLATRAGNTGVKVVLVGIDGATFSILEPLMREGRLPTLRRLIDGGAHGLLQSERPIISPAIWTTIATGRSRSEHGIDDFTRTGWTWLPGSKTLIRSTDRQVSALWNWPGLFDRTVGFQGWWASWPAEPVNGWIVSDRLPRSRWSEWTGDRPATAITYPEVLLGSLESTVVDPMDPPMDEIDTLVQLTAEERDEFLAVENPIFGHALSVFKFGYCAQRTYEEISLEMLDRGQPDLMGIFLIATDAISHTFWEFFDPDAFDGVDPDRARRLGPLIPAIYEHNDRYLARLLSRLDPETVVMVVSDHGFQASGVRPRELWWVERLFRPFSSAGVDGGQVAVGQSGKHHLDGIFIAHGPGIRAGVKSHPLLLDIAPTVLALMGLPVPDDLEGRVLTEILEPGFLDRHPVARLPSYDPYFTRDGEAPELDDEQQRETLRSLGYID